MNHWLYLSIDLGSFLIPFIFSFHPKIKFHKELPAFLIALIIIISGFIIWDQAFTTLGIWGFNENYISGIYIGSLPIEEILFFICIPYACVFTYHCFKLFLNFNWSEKITNRISHVSIILLTISTIVFHDQLYTFFTSLLLAFFLSYIVIIDKFFPIQKIYLAWIFLLIPFLIVNGILTGTGLDEPVVWYNNDHNLGIRILTIPIEDIFYGFLLFGTIVFLYEKLKLLFLKNDQIK